MNAIERFAARRPVPFVIAATVIWVLVAGILALGSCASGALPTPTPTATPTATLALKPTPVIENRLSAAERAEIFEAVWQTVNDNIDELHDAPALIIDLRGNPGGVFPVRKAIASQLVGERALFMRYQLRDEVQEAYLDVVADPYRGLVVILVDELSASSSEEFAGSLQALGRATIVGSPTPGRCLVSNIVQLPGGGVLSYPFGQSQTPDGRVLEGNGVVPDVEVGLDRHLLLQGIDTQLEAAIDYAVGRIR